MYYGTKNDKKQKAIVTDYHFGEKKIKSATITSERDSDWSRFLVSEVIVTGHCMTI